MNQKLLALYDLKRNTFSAELPTEAVYRSPKIENFCWRIEQSLLREGGFSLVHGDPGSSKRSRRAAIVITRKPRTHARCSNE